MPNSPEHQRNGDQARRKGRQDGPLWQKARALLPASAFLLGALGAFACSPGASTSSSTHWVVCVKSADCTALDPNATCGTTGESAGYCVDGEGVPLELLPAFDAEFRGTTLDLETFRFELGADIRNGELQVYTESPSNVFVEDGELVLVARAESVDGADYTSGSIEVTEPFTYGRIEASILAPVAVGVTPSFWLLPAAPGEAETTCLAADDCITSTWPVWGGIVVMSGRSDASSVAALSYSTEPAPGSPLELEEVTSQTDVGPTMSTDYHLYAIEWGPERIDWFIDDELVGTADLTADAIYRPGGQHPFQQPFRIKVGLSVGGLAADPVASDFPHEMRVRSLSVLQVE